MTVTIDDLGGSVRWKVRKGCLWELDATSYTAPGVAEDISAATVTAIITANEASTTALKTFTVSKPNGGTDGVFRVRIADTSADLAVGDYWWSVEIDAGAGDEPVISGPFTVEPWGQA